MTKEGAPVVLIDCGHIRNLYSGLGQVAAQFARAAVAADGEFSFRFLAHPRFADFRRVVGGLGAQCVAPRFSPIGAVARIFDKEWTRYAYRGRGHVLRHALHRNFYRIPRADKTPLVLTIHDMHLLHDSPKRRKQGLARLQASIRRASALGFISEYARAIAAEHVDFGAAEQHIICNGVEKPGGAKRPEWFRGDLSQKDGKPRPFLFSVAQIAPSKNYHILPPMLAKLAGMNLIIAGRRKKYYAPQIVEAARRAGVGERVILPGAIDEAEKAWLLAHCAGFVFPSLREGFGIPVVEALHFGKPVFCFRNTALPEAGGEAAYYWQDESPTTMAELVAQTLAAEESDSARAPLAAARQKWAARFSWAQNAASYLDIYRRLSA